MTELWLPVLDAPGYEASTYGNIQSIDRVVQLVDGGQRHLPGRLLTPDYSGGKHGMVWLGPIRRYVHHVIADTFLGERPPGLNVLHHDDDKANNRPENLYFGTQSDNGRDCVANGLHPQANKTQCPSGHRYDEKNTRYWNGRRYCRACQTDRRSQQVHSVAA